MDESKESAIVGYQILNHMVGDLVAGTRVRDIFNATTKDIPRSVSTTHERMCMSYIFLTLVKIAEFYKHFHQIIPDTCRAEFKGLLKEIRRRKIQNFRNKVVGHIWDKKKNSALTISEIESIFQEAVENNSDLFLLWCNNQDSNEFPTTVVSIIEHTRDEIRRNFALTDEEIFENQT